ncbi:hypothetical protein BOX15_Mlig026367g1, partial [Macrostomum lignano]
VTSRLESAGMTLMEFFGCSLVAFSPVLVMFAFTVASNPLKIIILTCSSFFWLLSLLLSAVVWYAIVPLRGYLAFGMVVSVIFQEMIRVALYYLLKKAQLGLQKIAVAEEGESTRTLADSNEATGDSAVVSVTAASAAVVVSPGAAAQPSVVSLSGSSRTRVDRVRLTQETRPSSSGSQILDLNSLSYVCGLGFGFMSGAFAMVNLLADVSGPGSVGLAGEHEAFLLVSACLALLFSCLNICWTVVTFACLESRKLHLLAAVWSSHLLCSLLTLLNSPSNPVMSLAPTLTSLVCLIGCLLLSLALAGISIPSFLVSLVSPKWLCKAISIGRAGL